MACLTAILVLADAGCSSKPARKKGRSKAAAAREREERPLVEGPAGSEPTGTSATADAPPAAAEPSPEATAADATGARDTPVAEASPAEPLPADTPPPDSPGEPAGRSSAGIVPRPTSPLVDPDTAIPLDGGRVEVCSPVGWTRSPRSANYLVRYQPGPRKTFPSIVVTAEPAPEGLESVSATNQAKLVSAITTKLAETFPAAGAVKLIKKPAAATLGSHSGVAWAIPGTAEVGGLSEPVDRFAWGVVVGGRLYTVEARAPKGKVDDDAKAAAKAVAATLFRPAGAPTGQPEAAAVEAPAPAGAEAETGN